MSDIHQGCSSIKCPRCYNAFANDHELQNHLRSKDLCNVITHNAHDTHDDNDDKKGRGDIHKIFKCSCNKYFANKFNLQRHEKKCKVNLQITNKTSESSQPIQLISSNENNSYKNTLIENAMYGTLVKLLKFIDNKNFNNEYIQTLKTLSTIINFELINNNTNNIMSTNELSSIISCNNLPNNNVLSNNIQNNIVPPKNISNNPNIPIHINIPKPIIPNNTVSKSQDIKPRGITFEDAMNPDLLLVNTVKQPIDTSISTGDNNTNNIQNTINATNTTNTNNTTNTTNNINNDNKVVNVTFIYPFGYEDLSHLTSKQMINILASSNCLVSVLEAVYSRLENKNFHKRNLNRNTITTIDKERGIKVLNTKDFEKELLEKLLFLLQRIFFLCRHELSINNQILIWSKIQIIIKNTDDNKILNCISNMIEMNSEKKITDLFNKCKQQFDDDNLKNNAIKLVSNIVDEINNFTDDLKNVNVTIKYLKEDVWPYYEDDPDFDLKKAYNNINSLRIEDTLRFQAYQQILIAEKAYLETIEPTLGDINKLCDIQNSRAMEEYKILKDEFFPNEEIDREIYNKLIDEPLQKILNDSTFVRPLKTKKTQNLNKTITPN